MLSSKLTQEVASHNRKIVVTFNRNLSDALEAQQEIPLNSGSEFQDPNVIANLFHHHEDEKNNGQNPKRFPIPPVTNREHIQEFQTIFYDPTWKPQTIQSKPQYRSLGKSNGKGGGAWLVPTPHFWLGLPYQQRRSRPTWGSIALFIQWEEGDLYKEEFNSWLLLHRAIITISK